MMQPTRLLFAILVAAAIQGLAGCAAWQARNWDLSHLRDPRATDLDRRLASRPAPDSDEASQAAGSATSGRNPSGSGARADSP